MIWRRRWSSFGGWRGSWGVRGGEAILRFGATNGDFVSGVERQGTAHVKTVPRSRETWPSCPTTTFGINGCRAESACGYGPAGITSPKRFVTVN